VKTKNAVNFHLTRRPTGHAMLRMRNAKFTIRMDGQAINITLIIQLTPYTKLTYQIVTYSLLRKRDFYKKYSILLSLE